MRPGWEPGYAKCTWRPAVNRIPTPGEPLLAICVPTFNRASSLRNLFVSLDAVKVRFGDEVEICISNNGSIDGTREAVEAFARVHAVTEHHHASNVGGTLNIIAVAGLIRARWGIWCGDDDEINVDAIGRILERLRTLEPHTWVLVDCADLEGRGQYMRHFKEGGYAAAAFRRLMVRSGLDPFGFMGVHVFPRSAVSALRTLNVMEAQPWPHMVGLIRHVMRPRVRVHVLRETAVLQAKGGALLFWSAGDLVRIHLSKLRLVARSYAAEKRGYLFFHALMLRELYAPGKLKLLLLWKLCEHRDFNSTAIAEYREHYGHLGKLRFLAWPHHLFALLVNGIDRRLYKKIFEAADKTYLRRAYVEGKRTHRFFDGMHRGI